jgi:hypothetical protein
MLLTALARDENVTSCKIPAWKSSGVAGYRDHIFCGVFNAMVSIVPGMVRSPQAMSDCVVSGECWMKGGAVVRATQRFHEHEYRKSEVVVVPCGLTGAGHGYVVDAQPIVSER